MRLFNSLVALMGTVVGTAFAQTSDFHALTRPGMNEKVPAGSTYTVTWNVASKYEGEKVTIGLLGGDSGSSLHSLGTLGTADGDAGEFTWKVDSSLGSENTYGLVISLASDSSIFQYSTPFSISGGEVKSSSTSSEKPTSTSSKKEEKTTTSSSKEEKTSTTESKTTSSSSSEESTTTESSSTSSRDPSITTTLSTVTASRSRTSGESGPTGTDARSTSTATGQPNEDEDKGSGPNLSVGAWVGIVGGGVAGVAILLGMIGMIMKMMRRQEQERYRDIDGQY